MPALVWFGRRWRTGADDFTFSSALYFAALMACGIVGLSRITTDRSAGAESGATAEDFNYLKRCPGAPFVMGACFFGLSVVDLVAAVLFAVTAGLSMRGAIYEMSKRSLVPVFLYCNAASLLTILVLTATVSKYALYDGERRTCSSLSSRVLEGSLALNFTVCVLFVLSFALAFDPSGRKVYDTAEEYTHTWWRCVRTLCCRWSKERRDDDAFMDVAAILSQAFRAYDMVPSDIAAGLLLLHGYQYHSRRIIRDRVRFTPLPAGDPRAGREIVSSQAVPAKRLDAAQRELVRELQRYARFYMAAYGHLLYEFMHCCTGLPRLCCFDPLMCCRHREGKHYGSSSCNVTALLKQTQIPEEDLIMTSWSNHLFKPVHYVCYDRSTESVIIAVRGTMSLIDVGTDLAASPEIIELDGAAIGAGFAAHDYYVHGGMLQSARYVWRCLEYNGILELITHGAHKDRRVVVLGHSLGAGVALILSVLLHSDLPEVRGRMRCLAYAPPGGTLSEAVVAYCKDFTVGGFMGYDMIPRLALHTFDTLRESIFDVSAASSTPKSLVYLNAMRTGAVARNMHPLATARSTPTTTATTSTTVQAPSPTGADASPTVTLSTPATPAVSQSLSRASGVPLAPSVEVGASPESSRYRAGLRQGSCVPAGRPRRLYPCHTLIHFRKAVERPAAMCCGVCGESALCCGCCTGPHHVCVEEVYYPCVEGPRDVQVLLAAPTMFSDHFPDRFYDVMRETVARMDAQELERFYEDTEPPAILETEAPMVYLSPSDLRRQQEFWCSEGTPSQASAHTYGSIV